MFRVLFTNLQLSKRLLNNQSIYHCNINKGCLTYVANVKIVAEVWLSRIRKTVNSTTR